MSANESQSQQLRDVMEKVLESLAFLFPFDSDNPEAKAYYKGESYKEIKEDLEKQGRKRDVWEQTVYFSGEGKASDGEMTLTMDSRDLKEATVNILGTDENDFVGDEVLLDAMEVLADTICAHVLPRVTNRNNVFHIQNKASYLDGSESRRFHSHCYAQSRLNFGEVSCRLIFGPISIKKKEHEGELDKNIKQLFLDITDRRSVNVYKH